MAIAFDKFTVDNGAIRDLAELLFETLYNDPDIELVVSTETGVVNGEKLGRIQSMGDVGTAGSGCKPTYVKPVITGVEKTWALGTYQIPLELCYADLENTLAKYGMNGGTQIGNLIDTPYWDMVLMPMLQKAIVDMFWRVVWFADKDAKNISDSGIITNGVKTNLFTMCDGLFKQLKAITAANSHQLTTIAANVAKEGTGDTAKVTYASQKAAIRQKGVAIGIVDDMLSDCDSRIFDDEAAAIYMTNGLFKALRNDVKNLQNLQLTTEQIASGIQLSNYDGHPILVLDVWDRLIRKYEDNGTSLNAPYRAVISTPNNLFVGTDDTKRIADLDVTFDTKDRMNYIFAQSKIGTLVGEDALVHVAM